MPNLYKRVQLRSDSVVIGEKVGAEVVNLEEPSKENEALRLEKEKIIAQAEREAQRLLSQAQGAVEEIRKKAWEEGWQKGLREGREKGREEVQKLFAEK
ncbi:MAG: hypothetical protein ACP5Q4_08145, partial [Candidatus Caldatribacteriaceae bacterium]